MIGDTTHQKEEEGKQIRIKDKHIDDGDGRTTFYLHRNKDFTVRDRFVFII